MLFVRTFCVLAFLFCWLVFQYLLLGQCSAGATGEVSGGWVRIEYRRGTRVDVEVGTSLVIIRDTMAKLQRSHTSNHGRLGKFAITRHETESE